MSGKIVDSLALDHRIEISIDLKPALDRKKLDQRLLREFDRYGKKSIENILRNLLPRKMIKTCLEHANIYSDKLGNQIDSEERNRLVNWFKDFRFKITGSLPIESAIITAGGIALNEVDPRTMQSQIVDGLFFAGEVLDLAADTGGYNLQESFSTGWLAGKSAAKYLNQ
jgi:predicted Rossmann fold flavoprotein